LPFALPDPHNHKPQTKLPFRIKAMLTPGISDFSINLSAYWSREEEKSSIEIPGPGEDFVQPAVVISALA